MLKLYVPESEQFDSKTNTFYNVTLEHSLVSISKWESKWKRPFLSEAPRTYKESIDYIRCMTVNQNVDPLVYNCLTPSMFKLINDYIGEDQTATTFKQDPNAKKSREIVTSELIYYWMVSLNIPFECQKWHLSRLLTLIRVCSIKNAPAKKMSKRDIMAQNRSLNAARRRAHHTRG